MLTRRLLIALHWACGRRNGVSAGALLRFVFEPTHDRVARGMIQSMTSSREDALLEVRAVGVSSSIFFPLDTLRAEIHQALYDILKPDQWHYYEVPKTRLQPGDIVADCGAAEGLFALTVAARCRRVFAIEPALAFIRTLSRTVAGLSNVSILPCALGETDGMARLSDEGIQSRLTAQDTGQPVEMRSIDSLFAQQGQPLDYLKADPEGAEARMLRGAMSPLRLYAPRIAITTYHHPDHAEQITALLKVANPRYSVITKGIMPQDGQPVMLHAWVNP